jgi:dihydropyrimidinase
MHAEITADLVIHGGTVVNAAGRRRATVVIHEGRVTHVLGADELIPDAKRSIDATGKLVIPGGVDPHCHIGQHLGEFPMLDDYEQATVAALWGGTTTVIDFAIPSPGQRPLDAAHARRKVADRARCDTALHGAVIDWDSTTAAQLASLGELGVLTAKMFTTYRDGTMADSQTIESVMRALNDLGGIAYVHAESNHVIEDAQREANHRSEGDAAHHAGTRPEAAELAAVREVLAIAERTGAAVYFVHQTTAEAVDLVADARRRGVRAYSETCPHYLVLDDTMYQTETPERFVCCPPLRSASSVSRLRARVIAGDVDTIGSDHCCYSTEQKQLHAHDVRRMPNGMPGVESRLTVSFDTLVIKGGMPVENFVALVSTTPAVLNGLRTKGWIGAGADADVVVFDPDLTRVITAADHHMASDYSPYEGRSFTGWPVAVISAGRVVIDQHGFHDPGPVGRPLRALAQLDSARGVLNHIGDGVETAHAVGGRA